MKRPLTWFLFIVVGLGCLTPRSAAEPVGSPSSILRKGQWVFGLSMGGVRRDVKKSNVRSQVSIIHGGHSRGYGLTDWLSAYLGIGAAYLELDNPGARDGFGTDVAFTGQLKTRLFQSRRHNWEWDASTQYVYYGSPHSNRTNDGNWHEWQIASSLAKSFGRWTPYVGVKYSRVNFDFKIRRKPRPINSGTFQQDGAISPFLGLDVYLGSAETVILNVEGSLVDRAEVDVALAYRF